VSVVIAHTVYFRAFARSEIFQKNAKELGVGRGQFHSGVNGLSEKASLPSPFDVKSTCMCIFLK